jgi:hypothetical protein
MVLGPAGDRRCWGSGRPQKPFRKVGGEAPHLLEGFVGPAGPPRPQTSTIFGRPQNHALKPKFCSPSGLHETPLQQQKRADGRTGQRSKRLPEPGPRKKRAYEPPAPKPCIKNPSIDRFKTTGMANAQPDEATDFSFGGRTENVHEMALGLVPGADFKCILHHLSNPSRLKGSLRPSSAGKRPKPTKTKL